jgi:hypothetical protein
MQSCDGYNLLDCANTVNINSDSTLKPRLLCLLSGVISLTSLHFYNFLLGKWIFMPHCYKKKLHKLADASPNIILAPRGRTNVPIRNPGKQQKLI